MLEAVVSDVSEQLAVLVGPFVVAPAKLVGCSGGPLVAPPLRKQQKHPPEQVSENRNAKAVWTEFIGQSVVQSAGQIAIRGGIPDP